MLAFRFYASGCFLEVIGDTMDVHKGTVSRAITNVTDALLSKKKKEKKKEDQVSAVAYTRGDDEIEESLLYAWWISRDNWVC